MTHTHTHTILENKKNMQNSVEYLHTLKYFIILFFRKSQEEIKVRYLLFYSLVECFI